MTRVGRLCRKCKLVLSAVAGSAYAWAPADAAARTVRFINVEPDVTLEVLDWGGTGRPMAGR